MASVAQQLFESGVLHMRRDALEAQARVIARALFQVNALLHRTEADFDAAPYVVQCDYLHKAYAAIALNLTGMRLIAEQTAVDKTEQLVDRESDLFSEGDRAVATEAISQFQTALAAAYRNERGRL